MSTREQIKQLQADAAVAFGAMLRRWREVNGWTQYTATDWAAEADPAFEAPAHSGLSELETGKTRNPRAPVFVFLAEVNRRVADADFRGVRTRKLRDQLIDSRAIVGSDGEPWGAAQFWECHAGLRAAPDWLLPVVPQPAPTLTEVAAADLGDNWREQVIEAGAAMGLRPFVAMAQFAKACPTKHRETIEDGLAAGFTREQVNAMWDGAAGEWGPVAWIAKWRAALPSRSAEPVEV
jgi:hypothetical protein